MTDYTRELKIAELIVRQEIGELDTAEQQALSQWLEEPEAHAALYRRLLTKPQTISPAAEFDTERFIRGTRRKIQHHKIHRLVWQSASAAGRSVFCLIHPGKQAMVQEGGRYYGLGGRCGVVYFVDCRDFQI
ncbi:MAG: hypothetical protein ACLTSL_14475 [Odoribacter splanchnicus]